MGKFKNCKNGPMHIRLQSRRHCRPKNQRMTARKVRAPTHTTTSLHPTPCHMKKKRDPHPHSHGLIFKLKGAHMHHHVDTWIINISNRHPEERKATHVHAIPNTCDCIATQVLWTRVHAVPNWSVRTCPIFHGRVSTRNGRVY